MDLFTTEWDASATATRHIGLAERAGSHRMSVLDATGGIATVRLTGARPGAADGWTVESGVLIGLAAAAVSAALISVAGAADEVDHARRVTDSIRLEFHDDPDGPLTASCLLSAADADRAREVYQGRLDQFSLSATSVIAGPFGRVICTAYIDATVYAYAVRAPSRHTDPIGWSRTA